MFINEKILKKIMLKAYKGTGLYMGNYDGYYYLGEPFSSSWEAKIAVGCVPKTILAMMVECAGEIPQEDEGWTTDKSTVQAEAFKKWSLEEPADPKLVVPTPLSIQSRGGVLYRLAQLPHNNMLTAVHPALLQAIDPRCIDRQNEETMIEGPYYDGRRGIYAKTNQATFHIWTGNIPETDTIMDILNNADASYAYDEDPQQ